jgi:predicted ATPase
MVRGISAPVEVFQLISFKHAPASERFRSGPRPSPLSGRKQELAALELELVATMRGDARVVGIVAEAGLGKSRLCFEFAETCRRKNIRVLEARVLPYGRDTPLQPVLELLTANTVTISQPVQSPGVQQKDWITFISFPVVSLQATGQSASGTLTFNTVPTALIQQGMGVVDYTTSGNIPINTVVNAVTSTTVTLSLPAGSATNVQNNDWIGFLATGNHQNLMRRWKYFLKNDLQSKCDAEIRAALLKSVLDSSVQYVLFDSIEGTSQVVHTALEYGAAANFATLGAQYMNIVLETPPTKAGSDLVAPIPLDDQFS